MSSPNARPLLVLAALAAAAEPDLGRDLASRAKRAMREGFSQDPMGTTLGTVLVGAWLFYRAEHGHNPKVASFYDALVYVSTNLSVGYCDIFAKTDAGKAIGSALMTYGPAMATRIFDRPSPPETGPAPAGASAPIDEATARAIVDRLDRILAALEGRASSAP